ncbi:NAD-binding Rossmann fold oxidoreductase [Penicillium lagena]|uniref:NAD-binding Rossmann fold oxidoreductase n=1 Tax=Penicillium lagena TaxID=94218 RepID=UPI00254033F3|nr:NAD-binding Rossmann fold oxidoreductase [Penicillium lagena]KAJ5601148.1 NAD-binding Rossmann fold oxidoreductase [Penicillium lagena]
MVFLAHLPALVEHKANLVAVYSRSVSSAQSLVSASAALNVPISGIDVYAEELASENRGLSALLKREDIGAVVVALPILIQPGIVRQCLAAGKHVLCEKPFAKNVETAVQLIADYEKDHRPRGLVLSVAEQFRYDRAFTRARELVASGRIGKLNHVHGRVWGNIQPGDNKWYETEWRKNPEYQGGFVLDGGVHFVALIRYVSGQEIVKTLSMCRQTYPHLPPLDTVNAALQFDNGASGSLSICFASCKGTFEFIFVGDQGSVTVSGVEKKEDCQRIVLEKADGTKEIDEAIVGQGISEEVKAFLDAAAGGKHDAKAGAREALADIAVVESLCSGGGQVQTLL